MAKVSKHAQAQVKADYWAIFDLAEDVEPGLDAVQTVQARIDAFAVRWRDSYPAAVRSLLADRESLTVYLRFPREHWTRVRHSNFIERTFGETRRRVKVIGRLPGEHTCISLVWAVLDRASAGWRGFTMTPAGVRLLQDLRRTLHDPPTPLPRQNSPNASKRPSHQPIPQPSRRITMQASGAYLRQLLHRSWDATWLHCVCCITIAASAPVPRGLSADGSDWMATAGNAGFPHPSLHKLSFVFHKLSFTFHRLPCA